RHALTRSGSPWQRLASIRWDRLAARCARGGCVAQGRFFRRKSLSGKAGSPAPHGWRRGGSLAQGRGCSADAGYRGRMVTWSAHASEGCPVATCGEGPVCHLAKRGGSVLPAAEPLRVADMGVRLRTLQECADHALQSTRERVDGLTEFCWNRSG